MLAKDMGTYRSGFVGSAGTLLSVSRFPNAVASTGHASAQAGSLSAIGPNRRTSIFGTGLSCQTWISNGRRPCRTCSPCIFFARSRTLLVFSMAWWAGGYACVDCGAHSIREHLAALGRAVYDRPLRLDGIVASITRSSGRFRNPCVSAQANSQLHRCSASYPRTPTNRPAVPGPPGEMHQQ
jgi:hypothetical protein